MESVSLPAKGSAIVDARGQVRPPSFDLLATTAVAGGSIDKSAARPLK